MIEFFNHTVLWWHWIVLGFILLIIEMGTGTFFMLGLGVAGVFVGVFDYYLELQFSTEMLIWLIISLIFISAWFIWIRQKPVTQSGQSNYRLDTLGTVEKKIEPNRRGKVVFDHPVLGNTTWHATSKEDLPINTRVKIIEVNGQLIEVASI